MREILAGELDAVLARRGLRARQWAVEFDDSALEFLLAEGFTPDLGARPLKRAVERHFLTPLALAIAGHDYPGGDQFLFVRAGGDGLKVTFVDPDAHASAAAGAGASRSRCGRWPARAGALDAARGARSRRSPRGVGRRGWQDAKATCSRAWASRASGRTRAASRCSRGSSCATASRPACAARSSLINRIRSARRPPAALVRRAAQRVLLLDEALDALDAGEPADAPLRVDGDPEFAPRIVAMYRAWARERGMRLEGAEQPPANRRYRWAATVTGFGALRTLRPEAGLHVLEVPDGRGGYDRRRVRVTVTPEAPDRRGEPTIVRRYRERPTPLVRDAVRGWRTGRLDAVLAGGFDLIE